MRHKAQVQNFGRSTNARNALIRGLVFALVRDGRIKTTLAKAKELKRHVERAVTLAKTGDLNSRRVLLARYPNKTTVSSLMDTIAPRFKKQPGGYTRIIKVGVRPGDIAEMALIEWIDFEPLNVSADSDKEKGSVKTVKKEKSPAKKKVKKAPTSKTKAL